MLLCTILNLFFYIAENHFYLYNNQYRLQLNYFTVDCMDYTFPVVRVHSHVTATSWWPQHENAPLEMVNDLLFTLTTAISLGEKYGLHNQYIDH